MADHTPSDFTIVVFDVVQETPVDRTLHLQIADEQRADFRFEPGQHVCIWDPAVEGAPRRYFSISGGDSEAGLLQITIRKSGDTEPAYYNSPPGLLLRSTAPGGSFVLAYEPGDELILIGGGSGITPFRAYVEALHARGDAPRTVIAHSARDPARLLFREELAAWAGAADWLHYEPLVTGDAAEWSGRTGRLDQAALRNLISDAAKTIVCACGRNEFVDAVLDAAKACGIPAERCRREGW